MSNPRRRLRIGFFICFIAGIILYSLFQAKNLIEGPEVVVSEPHNGATLENEMVFVRGSARNIAYIWLNERQIFVNDKGIFEEKLIAPVGYSIIKVRAIDKFGKEAERFIHVHLPSEFGPSLPEPPSEESLPEESLSNEEEMPDEPVPEVEGSAPIEEVGQE